jgi:hypothetical protein
MAILRAKELYSNVEQNAEIVISGTQDFAIDAVSTANKSKYGSMNVLLIVNRSAQAVRVTLDGTTFAELFANSTLTINVEDGLFFNLIRLTNLSTTAVVTASTITVRYGKNLITGVL